MRTQDDAAFQSQQFANQVEGRRDQIAQTQIGLNLQAGQLSGQAIQAWREGQQFQMEQAMDATNLTADQFKLQQAAEELAWARQLRSDKMLRNLLERDNAQTQLAIAQAQSERTKLKGFDPQRFSDPLHRLGALAAGLDVKYDSASGQVQVGKDPLPQSARDNAMSQYLRTVEARNSRSRAAAPQDETASMKRLVDLGNAAMEQGDLEAAKRFFGQAGIKIEDEAPQAKPTVKASMQASSLPGFAPENADKIVAHISRPEEIAGIREMLKSRVAPARREGYNPSDQEVVEEVLNILRDIRNPMFVGVAKVLMQDGVLAEDDVRTAFDSQSTSLSGQSVPPALKRPYNGPPHPLLGGGQ